MLVIPVLSLLLGAVLYLGSRTMARDAWKREEAVGLDENHFSRAAG